VELGVGGRVILNSPLINVLRYGQLAVDSLHCLEMFKTLRDFAFGKRQAIACSSNLPLFVKKRSLPRGVINEIYKNDT